jgi:hypothetical protein
VRHLNASRDRHGRGHLPDGVASNASSLSKLSRDRLQGLYPGVVRVVERAIQLTPQDFRVQEGLRTRERQAELVARGASRSMNSRHLTGHAVDLVALGGGEISWQWRASFWSQPPCRPRRVDRWSLSLPGRFERCRRQCRRPRLGSAVVDVTPGDYFELIVRQTSGSTRNVAANELTWFAIEVVE